jgi:hypothetical protein
MLSRLWKWESVSIGAPLWGNMEGRFFPKVFYRRNFFLVKQFLFEEIESYVKKGL